MKNYLKQTQIFTYIKYAGLLLCSAILLFSCSKDDGGGNEPDPVDPDPTDKTELVLTASATEIDKGDTVTFEITADGKPIEADIYIDDNKIADASHTFDTAGTFQAIAKKEGYTDSKAVAIKVAAEKVKVATATFTQKNITAYPATFPGSRYDQIGIMNEHIYVMDYDSKKFRRYSITSNQWEDLANENSLPNGISGYLTAHRGVDNKDILVYLGGSRGEINIYYPSEYPDATLKDSWGSQEVMPSDQDGERAAASDGEYIYFMGNSRAENYSRQIDRYVPAHDLWEESIGYLPEGIGWIPQTVFADNKLFVIGQNLANDGNVFFVYNLLTQTSTSKSVPSDLQPSGICNNTMVIYEDYLIYMQPGGSSSVKLHVYDIKEEQWLEDAVSIEMNLFTKTSDNASLLLSSSGQLYAAGTKGGDFVFYEVDFKVTEQ